MGKIEQDSECSYERGLVEMFVAETKLHGDPVHYGRSLGMKAEHLARLGKVHEAFDSLRILDDIYDVDKHSVAVCKAYGSDRCAQAISVSVLWNLQLGRVEKARETCDFVLNKLFGKMDLRNVHNTMMILYPIFFVMKDWGHAQKMRKLLNKSIVKPFYEHFGEGGSTPLLILYKPLDMLFEVCQEGEVHDLSGKVDWILEGRNGILGDFIDLSMGTFGRTGASITGEICLHLARRIEDLDKKRQLLAKGTALARRSICICLRDPKMPFAYNQTEPVHQALEEMVVEFDVPEDMITNKTFDYV